MRFLANKLCQIKIQIYNNLPIALSVGMRLSIKQASSTGDPEKILILSFSTDCIAVCLYLFHLRKCPALNPSYSVLCDDLAAKLSDEISTGCGNFFRIKEKYLQKQWKFNLRSDII